MTRAFLVLVALGLVSAHSDALAKKPKKAAAAPITGWHREEGWAGDCWYPPDFGTMAEGAKRMAWQESRDAIVGQWRGDRGDGVSLNPNYVERLETTMLSKADRVEQVARENLEQCKAARASNSTDAWGQWIVSINAKLTEGECPYPPLDYTAFQTLSINDGWQFPLNICKGNRVNVHGSEQDYFQLEPKGPWINIAGDPAQPASGGSLPCTIEGCLRGQLVMRFTSDSGVSQIVPVGIDLDFLAPEHGRIEVMINDDSMSDNKFKVERGVEHHTTLTVKPAN